MSSTRLTCFNGTPEPPAAEVHRAACSPQGARGRTGLIRDATGQSTAILCIRHQPSSQKRLFLSSLREQPVPDVASGRGQAQTMRLAPIGTVDFSFVADRQPTGCLLRNKNCIAHLSTTAPIFRFDFLPEMHSTQLELGKLLLDF